MAQSVDNSPGDNEKPKPEAAETQAAKTQAADAQASNPVDHNLPMVVAPKLGAGEDEAFDETPNESESEVHAAAVPVPSARFLALAATVAFAAAFGSFVGSVSGSGLAHFVYAAPAAAPVAASSEAAADTLRAVKQQLAELSAIKANLDTASRNSTSQFAKLADRLDKIDQHAAAAETTGSIAAAPAVPAAPAPPAPSSVSVKLTDRVLPNWVVQDVRYGRALVESNRGGLFEVSAGSMLPGLGRVGSVKRQDGQWVVVTENGTITSTGR
jgi:hypothetical protein